MALDNVWEQYQEVSEKLTSLIGETQPYLGAHELSMIRFVHIAFDGALCEVIYAAEEKMHQDAMEGNKY